MKSWMAVFATLALAACSGSFADVPKPDPVKLSITGDTFCRQISTTDPVTRERQLALSWESRDSPQTATAVERIGAKYDRVCGAKPALAPLK
jgi:hypothetical protein